MGYRSNVAIAFYTREPDKGRAAFVKAWLQNNGALNDEDGDYEFVKERGVLIRFNDVKWYPSYPEVQMLTAVFDKFEDELCTKTNDPEETLYACEFMRIGEEDDDIETRRSDYNEYVLNLNREIAADL